MQTKTKTYTQDGVTIEMWAFDSVAVKMRWQAFFAAFKGQVIVGPLAQFALFMVYNKAFHLGDLPTEAWRDFAAWEIIHRDAIQAMQFKEVWESFMEQDSDILPFFSRAYEQTRREYVRASEELAKDETDVPGNEDFLAVDESALLISA